MADSQHNYAKIERDILIQFDHPFIIQLQYAFQTPDKLILVLNYASGGTLNRTLKKEKRFT